MKIKKITSLLLSFVLVSGTFLTETQTVGKAYGLQTKVNGNTFELGGSGKYVFDKEKGSDVHIYDICRYESDTLAEKVVIPERLNEYRIGGVKAINSENVKNLVLSDGIMFIENTEKSLGCPNLECIVMPDELVSIQGKGLGADIVLIGNRNTYAEYYSKKNGNVFRELGDINNDGKVSVSDLVKTISGVLCADKTDEMSKLSVDFNHDGMLGVLDVLFMKQRLLEDDTNGSAVISGCVAAPELMSISRVTEKAPIKPYSSFASEFTDDILLGTVDQNGEENTVYSPVSLYMALSVLAECSDNATLDELLNVLKVDSKESLQDVNRRLFESLYFDDFTVYNKITNSIWIDDECVPVSDCLKKLAENYYTACFMKDYASAQTPEDMRQWIYDNTSGKLNPEIKIDDLEFIRIINTITFKEKWRSRFEKTETGFFTLENGEKVSCDFLKSDYERGSAVVSEKYVKYIRDFNDGYRMNFVLPNEGTSVNDILSDSDVMHEIFSECYKKADTYDITNLLIPELNIKSKLKLDDAVKKIGAEGIYKSADLSTLLGKEQNNVLSPSVKEILQEAVLTVDQDGCEAAAYTSMNIVTTCAYPHIEFVADRPFMYYISDANNTPIFIGVINDPTAE